MSVVGENRSQLPFPQLERNKQGINLRPSSVEVLIDYLDDSTSYSFDKRTRLPVPLPFENDFASLTDEVTCENVSPSPAKQERLPVPFAAGKDSASSFDENACEEDLASNEPSVPKSDGGYRFRLTVAFLVAAIVVASFASRSRQEAQIAEHQEIAVQHPATAVANQGKTEVSTRPVLRQFDIGSESLGCLVETSVPLANDRQESVVEVPAVSNIDFELFTSELVKKLKTVIDRDNSSQEPELANSEVELPVDSDLLDAPVLDPSILEAPDLPLPLDWPKHDWPKHGTAISWMPTLKSAMKSAVASEKLVFLLQVSGNFALEEFT